MTRPLERVEDDVVNIAGEVREVTTAGWPGGYRYGATRYADVILQQSFKGRFRDLADTLDRFHPTLEELRSGGGGRTVFVRRFDDALAGLTELRMDTRFGASKTLPSTNGSVWMAPPC